MAAGHSLSTMRASDQDRAGVQAILNESFAEGRLTKDEWEQRAASLASAITYADLDQLTFDLPAQFPGPRYDDPPPPVPYWQPVQPRRPVQTLRPTNQMAVASLACAFGQLLVGPMAGIAAIVLGYRAERTIRETGQPGGGLARAGIVLGFLGVGITVLLFLLGFVLILGGALAGGFN